MYKHKKTDKIEQWLTLPRMGTGDQVSLKLSRILAIEEVSESKINDTAFTVIVYDVDAKAPYHYNIDATFDIIMQRIPPQ